MASKPDQEDMDLISKLVEEVAKINETVKGVAKNKREALASVREIYQQLETKLKEAFQNTSEQIETAFERESRDCYTNISAICDLQKRYVRQTCLNENPVVIVRFTNDNIECLARLCSPVDYRL